MAANVLSHSVWVFSVKRTITLKHSSTRKVQCAKVEKRKHNFHSNKLNTKNVGGSERTSNPSKSKAAADALPYPKGLVGLECEQIRWHKRFCLSAQLRKQNGVLWRT